jgi:DNA polymerase-4/DNA polymerase IV (DinB-like DNA polymerase)
MNKIIIHVDMDAFYASVETRDNPALIGKPLIIGGKPNEQGVVSTCNYEARKYGIHSAMNINEAYRLCPNGIFMQPDIPKYEKVSQALHEIWCDYTNLVEFLSLDEGYLDVTGSADAFGGAKNIALQIKERTQREIGLTCSVGIGYSMASAKTASEEKKPDGFFEIPDPEFFKALVLDRDVRVIFGVGAKTAEALHSLGIVTVRDVLNCRQQVGALFGRRGSQIVALANGIDTREVTPYYESEMKSIGREETFQTDTTDRLYIKGFLFSFAKELGMKLRSSGLYCQTVTLKITFGDMKVISRSKSGEPTNSVDDIYTTAAALLDAVEPKPIRLAGISLSSFTKNAYHQLSLDDLANEDSLNRKNALDHSLYELQKKYGTGIIKTGFELQSEK